MITLLKIAAAVLASARLRRPVPSAAKDR